MAEKLKSETVVLGGGCFWCTEAVFSQLRGVIRVTPGYAGGQAAEPGYRGVSSGQTGHAEVIKVEFDPAAIVFSDLLSISFATHDPTTLNRQGHDVGSQYRSIILYTSDQQRQTAEEFIQKLEQHEFKGKKIVTTVEPLRSFFEAEDYHREYYKNNSSAPYCQVVIDPKLTRLRQKFSQFLKISN